MDRGNPGTCNSTLTPSLHFGKRSLETAKGVREMPKKNRAAIPSGDRRALGAAALEPFLSETFLSETFLSVTFLDYILPFR